MKYFEEKFKWLLRINREKNDLMISSTLTSFQEYVSKKRSRLIYKTLGHLPL